MLVWGSWKKSSNLLLELDFNKCQQLEKEFLPVTWTGFNSACLWQLEKKSSCYLLLELVLTDPCLWCLEKEFLPVKWTGFKNAGLWQLEKEFLPASLWKLEKEFLPITWTGCNKCL